MVLDHCVLLCIYNGRHLWEDRNEKLTNKALLIMKEIEKNESQARQEYEPMEIKVMTVTPQGVLCQSGAPAASKGLKSYKGF